MKCTSKDKIIKIINSPNYLSISTSFGDQIFNYSAIAMTECSICVTDKETFKNLILQNKFFAFEIIKYLCENEINQYHKSVCLLQQNLNGRIANCLIEFSKNIYKCNKFKICRKDLMEITNNSRENISRAISKFNKDGIINLHGEEIEILDFERLVQISRNG